MDKYVCYEGKDITRGCNQPCEDCPSYGADRRVGDRRRRGFSLRLAERREGFDRRKNHAKKKGLYYRIFTYGAWHLRGNNPALITLLILFNALNIADYVFTLKALSVGFIEGNPIMEKMFVAGPVAAGAFKIVLASAITLIIWIFRRYRLVLEISILFLIVYTLLIAYHIYDAAVYYL